MRSFDTRFVTNFRCTLETITRSLPQLNCIDRTVISLDRLITFVNYVYGLA